MEDEERRAMEEGTLARLQGMKKPSCPYDENDDRHGWWHEGFDHADEVDADGEPLEE